MLLSNFGFRWCSIFNVIYWIFQWYLLLYKYHTTPWLSFNLTTNHTYCVFLTLFGHFFTLSQDQGNLVPITLNVIFVLSYTATLFPTAFSTAFARYYIDPQTNTITPFPGRYLPCQLKDKLGSIICLKGNSNSLKLDESGGWYLSRDKYPNGYLTLKPYLPHFEKCVKALTLSSLTNLEPRSDLPIFGNVFVCFENSIFFLQELNLES